MNRKGFFAALALCLPLWGQTNTLTFSGTEIPISTQTLGGITTSTLTYSPPSAESEQAAHQAYRLALADFALLITKGPITVDALEAAFEKIDAAKAKWVMSKGASVDLGSVPKSNGTIFWLVACADGSLAPHGGCGSGTVELNSPLIAGKPHFTPIRPGDLPAGTGIVRESHDEGGAYNITPDPSRSSIDRSDAKFINRVKVKK